MAKNLDREELHTPSSRRGSKGQQALPATVKARGSLAASVVVYDIKTKGLFRWRQLRMGCSGELVRSVELLEFTLMGEAIILLMGLGKGIA